MMDIGKSIGTARQRRGIVIRDDKDKEQQDITTRASLLELNVDEISSAALARLIEEVRNDEPATNRAYDRVHNRHNR